MHILLACGELVCIYFFFARCVKCRCYIYVIAPMILCVVQICQPLKFAEWKEKCRRICQEELVHCLHTHLRSAFVYQIACCFFTYMTLTVQTKVLVFIWWSCLLKVQNLVPSV